MNRFARMWGIENGPFGPFEYGQVVAFDHDIIRNAEQPNELFASPYPRLIDLVEAEWKRASQAAVQNLPKGAFVEGECSSPTNLADFELILNDVCKQTIWSHPAIQGVIGLLCKNEKNNTVLRGGLWAHLAGLLDGLCELTV